VEFRILGAVEVWSNGRRQDIGWARERLLLAGLLMTPGRPIATETLVERLWDSRSRPAQARDRLYIHIARLRSRLHEIGDGAELRHHPGAYSLETDEQTIDLHRFRLLRVQAKAMADSGDDEHAVRLLGEAALLWRGTPLTGVDGDWAARTRKTLEDELLTGTVERIELELGLGHHADLVAEISELVARHPFDEKLAELLMLALSRCGRQAEALTVYRQAHERLADELGTDAGPGLRELHQRILSGDPSLVFRPARSSHPPNNLLRDLSTFTGRADEIAELTGGDRAPAVAIDGMAGVGKTTLATRLAHLLAPGFPDGQLFLDLCGHSAAREPLDADTALDRLLRLIGVPAGRIPAAFEDRVAAWRAELARRRLLFVLDDVVEPDQIRHLLPGQPGCLALVTSRRRLAGLDDVRAVTLDVLPPGDAAVLLGRIIGPHRDLDAGDVDQVVRHCGYLPLAIQLLGNRLRHRPAWSVADLSTRLATADHPGDRLAEIRAGNRELTFFFDLSFRDLRPDEARAFRLLGLHPGPDFSVPAATALLDATSREADRLLESLMDRHLLAETRPERYRFHDLLGEYARMHALRDPSAVRDAALDRLLSHYLTALAAAVHAVHPHQPRLEAAPGPLDVQRARDWLAAEQDNLIQLIDHAYQHGLSTTAARLCHLMAPYLEAAGLWAEAARLHERSVRTWQETGDLRALAAACTDAGTVLWRAGHFAEALQYASQALDMQRRRGDQAGTAFLLDTIGQIRWHLSEFDQALGPLEEALAVWETLGDRRGQAETLSHLAIVYWHRGNYPGAAHRFHQALTLFEEAGDTRGALMVLNNIGDVEFRWGHYERALEHYEKAAAIAKTGPQYQAILTNNIANVQRRTGQHEDALANFRAALAQYRDIGDRRGQADTLNNIGWCFLEMNRDGEGLIHLQKARHLAAEIGERYIQAEAMHGIGQAHARAGRFTPAMEHYHTALEFARSIGDAYQEATILEAMGTTCIQTGNPRQAQDHWTRAIQLYTTLGVPEADTLRRRQERPQDASG